MVKKNSLKKKKNIKRRRITKKGGADNDPPGSVNASGYQVPRRQMPSQSLMPTDAQGYLVPGQEQPHRNPHHTYTEPEGFHLIRDKKTGRLMNERFIHHEYAAHPVYAATPNGNNASGYAPPPIPSGRNNIVVEPATEANGRRKTVMRGRKKKVPENNNTTPLL